MADGSTIEWLAQPGTKPASWNPIRSRGPDGKLGWHCEHVTEACRFCYAEKMNRNRYYGNGSDYKPGVRSQIEIFLDEKKLLEPLHWRSPRTVFVCSMTDLYGSWVKDEWLDRIYAVMALCPQHTFIVLTKRPERMRGYLSAAETISRIKTSMLGLDNENTSRWENGARGVVNIDFEKLGWTYLTGQLCHPGCKPPCEFMWCADGKTTLPAHLYDGPDNATGGTCYGSAYWDGPLTLPNIWAGTSCSTQGDADKFIPEVLATRLAQRIVSLEPLLGPMHLGYLGWPEGKTRKRDGFNGLIGARYRDGEMVERLPKLDWVIVGGESGPNARPMHPDWARSLRDQCAAADVRFFFKQWGEFAPLDSFSDAKPDTHVYRIGKKAAGRLLDGREWNEFPVPSAGTLHLAHQAQGIC